MHVDAECEDDIARLLLGQLADLTRLAGDADEYLDRQARMAMANTAHAHTVWKRTNVRAEAERLLRGVRIDPTQRVIVANKIADKALSQCVKLTPDRYQVPKDALDNLSIATRQGQSVFEDADLDKYTTVDVLQAERYMIERLDKTVQLGYAPGEGNQWLDQWNKQMSAQGGYPLASDQQKAAAYVLENPRLVSSIIGPAGTGKTTTMKAVARHGRRDTVPAASSDWPPAKGGGRIERQHRMRKHDHREAPDHQQSRTDHGLHPTRGHAPTAVAQRVQPIGTIVRSHTHRGPTCPGHVGHDRTEPADHRGRGRHGRHQEPAMGHQTGGITWRESHTHRRSETARLCFRSWRHARLRRPARQVRAVDEPVEIHFEIREMGERSGRARIPATVGGRGGSDAPIA